MAKIEIKNLSILFGPEKSRAKKMILKEKQTGNTKRNRLYRCRA